MPSEAAAAITTAAANKPEAEAAILQQQFRLVFLMRVLWFFPLLRYAKLIEILFKRAGVAT